ncbi:PIN domain-containing protein [Planomonospora sp. ID82291]|uniref:PIN domain-containing protein n=1 Tax=Planomonospora sp. ID82291 TaxID=2738136 RepID=UPI0018C380A9|nr:PIN domain-containing protein [Planomonospora sp. ID82291]MBG0815488.1 PIN domain-containing protein [Planomonospora sp. ID82291]
MLVVVLDSSVLFPNTLRDVLLTLAENELYRPVWSSAILEEVRRNVLAKRRVAPAAFDRTLRLMSMAFEGAEVEGWEEYVDALTLPDPDDRHVLAAALASSAQVIVTANLDDFPDKTVNFYDVQAIHPDTFLMDLLDAFPGLVVNILRERATAYRRPPTDLGGLLTRLDRAGVSGFTEEVRRLVF